MNDLLSKSHATSSRSHRRTWRCDGGSASERAPFHNSITLDTFAASSEGAREASGREVVLIESARVDSGEIIIAHDWGSSFFTKVG